MFKTCVIDEILLKQMVIVHFNPLLVDLSDGRGCRLKVMSSRKFRIVAIMPK